MDFIKNGLLHDPAVPFLGVNSKELNMGVQTLVCSCSQELRSGKEPKCPSTDEWMNRIWCIPYNTVLFTTKRNEVLTQATSWVNLGNTLLSQISQAQKTSIMTAVR